MAFPQHGSLKQKALAESIAHDVLLPMVQNAGF